MPTKPNQEHQMPIINFLHHFIDFHGKASRREFILIFAISYAYLASLVYFDIYDITFDFGILGFVVLVLVLMLSILVLGSAVCRRNTSAGLSENYLVLWMACQLVVVFQQKLGSFSQILTFISYICILIYYLSLMMIKPQVVDEYLES